MSPESLISDIETTPQPLAPLCRRAGSGDDERPRDPGPPGVLLPAIRHDRGDAAGGGQSHPGLGPRLRRVRRRRAERRSPAEGGDPRGAGGPARPQARDGVVDRAVAGQAPSRSGDIRAQPQSGHQSRQQLLREGGAATGPRAPSCLGGDTQGTHRRARRAARRGEVHVGAPSRRGGLPLSLERPCPRQTDCPDSSRCSAIPSSPVSIPGTLLGHPRLSTCSIPPTAPRSTALPARELWDLERKSDVDLDTHLRRRHRRARVGGWRRWCS